MLECVHCPEGGTTVIKEFKEFVMRGNVVDLAVGVIIGAAFGKIRQFAGHRRLNAAHRNFGWRGGLQQSGPDPQASGGRENRRSRSITDYSSIRSSTS